MTEIPMLEYYSAQFRSGVSHTPIGRKGRIFTEICLADGTTRKKLAHDLDIRPSTVSDVVMELIEDGMVEESRPPKSIQKGRPEIILSPVSTRLFGAVCYSVSQTVYCVLINLAGEICYEVKREVTAGSLTKLDFRKLVNELYSICKSETPPNAILCGLALSLPGMVDERDKRWIYSAYWPNLSNFDLKPLEQDLGCRVAVMKNLGCELRARLSRKPPEKPGNTILIHWGLGLGAAISDADWTTDFGIAFGEIGHCTVDQQSTTVCKCGLTGCVEAEAGLWAIANAFPDEPIPLNESLFDTYLQSTQSHGFLDRPISLIAQTLRNLTLSHTPQNIVITGPFVQSYSIFQKLLEAYATILPDNLPISTCGRPTIAAGRQSIADERIGAAAVLFRAEIGERCI